MKYYLLVGEKSGDMHASNLMKEIKENDAEAEFRYLGGEGMVRQGGELYADYADVSYMGFWEVFKNVFTLKKKIKACAKDVLNWQPDIVVFIDFSGFNMRIAPLIDGKGIKLYYYIAPKVWAWNTKRVYKMVRYLDRVYCILPFEEFFFHSYGLPTYYMGNPIVDEILAYKPNERFLIGNKISDKPIIAILPGSRKQEIENILSKAIEVVEQFPDFQFVIAGVSHLPESLYAKALGGKDIKVVYNQTYDLLGHSTAAIVTSGTATLETALFNIPQVVVYKTSFITASIVKMVIKIDYVALVNLVADKMIVRELLQEKFTVDNIVMELQSIIINGEDRSVMLEEYAKLQANMGDAGVSGRVAKHMIK